MKYATGRLIFKKCLVITYPAIALKWLREASDNARLNYMTGHRKENERNAIRATDVTVLTSIWKTDT
jgi:hypothetical protein